MTIRVLLADDHLLFREVLATILAQQTDLIVVGGAKNGADVQDQVVALSPDVVLMDLEMPLVDGLHATRSLSRTHPLVKVIMLTAHITDGNVLQALAAGARGYFSKMVALPELVVAIRQVHDGRTVIETTLLRGVIGELHRLQSAESKTHPRPIVGLAALTVTDLKLLSLLESGRSNKEIASQLHRAESTIKNAMTLMFRKLGVQDRQQAAIYGLRHGISPEGNPLWNPTDDIEKGESP